MNYYLVKNSKRGPYNHATLKRRHTFKKMNKTKPSRNRTITGIPARKKKYWTSWSRSMQGTHYAIPGTALNRPKPTMEPRRYLINVRGKVYQRRREHLKPRPTTNITSIPRQETASPPLYTDITQEREAITMSTANKESNIPEENPTE